MRLLREAKRLAKDYRAVTGRPLGVTGEVAEYEAVRLLGLELAPVRQPGYDAIRRGQGGLTRLQIKGRCVGDRRATSQRLGGIKLEHEWDSVLMVLLDSDYEAVEIYEADRAAISAALTCPGSRARNERGSLPIGKFKAIGRRVWSRPQGASGR